MSRKLEEHVLCFPSELLQKLGYFQGISTDTVKYFPKIVSPPHIKYIPRKAAENDYNYKQVIPYVLFTYKRSIFSYRRGKHGGEKRLHEKYSVGVGGHIAVEDRTLFSEDNIGYGDAMWREVAEEIITDFPENPDCVAVINDDSTEVGKVHFGIVHVVRLTSPNIKKRESVITDSKLIPLEKAVHDINHYEKWSQLCLECISSDRIQL